MKEPHWIEPGIVAQVHAEQLAQHGGQDGLRDINLLESALHRPRNLWAYSDPKPDLTALAASLAFGVSRFSMATNERLGCFVVRFSCAMTRMSA